MFAPGNAGAGVLVALPLDARPDWHMAAGNLTEFLARYLTAFGEKYWEQSRR